MGNIYANQRPSRYKEGIRSCNLPCFVVQFEILQHIGLLLTSVSFRAEDTETDMHKVLNESQQAIDIIFSMEALISEKLVSQHDPILTERTEQTD